MSKLADVNRVRLAAELQRRLDAGYDYSYLLGMLFDAFCKAADPLNAETWLDALEAQKL